MVTRDQMDAFREMVNMGFGRAANALTYLMGHRITLEAPDLEFLPITELSQVFNFLQGEEMLTVHQVFSGKISGDTMLLFEARSAVKLIQLLTAPLKSVSTVPGFPPEIEHAEDLQSLSPEVIDYLSEVGNIVLAAFTGTFGNLLHIQISFTVPKLHQESVVTLLNSIRLQDAKLSEVVVVRLFFHLVEQNVGSHLLIVMGVESLDALFEAMIKEGYLSPRA